MGPGRAMLRGSSTVVGLERYGWLYIISGEGPKFISRGGFLGDPHSLPPPRGSNIPGRGSRVPSVLRRMQQVQRVPRVL